MKFTKPSWNAEPKIWAAFRQSLIAHHRQMQGILPPHVLALTELRGVDDGLVVEVRHDRTEHVLKLTLRCGDLVMGYYNLALTYVDAEISPRDERLLARIARNTVDAWRHESDIVRQELDVTADGRIEHRLEFHVWGYSDAWFGIRCWELHWERTDRPNRELPILPDRFPDGPDNHVLYLGRYFPFGNRRSRLHKNWRTIRRRNARVHRRTE